MKELKQLIIDSLLDEYPLNEAIEAVSNAQIIIHKNTVKVIYDNGSTDLYKLVTTEKLELINS